MKLEHVKFLNKLNSLITSLGIDLTGAKLDHIGYQTATAEEYDRLKPEFEKMAKLIKEPIVGERRVGVFEFFEPLTYKGEEIKAIELIEPKKDQNPPSGLEHAEYLLPVTLEEFTSKYPKVNWNTDALNREEFPMLILKLTDSMTVKFPRYPILLS